MSQPLQRERVLLKPIKQLDHAAWQRVHAHFRDSEIAHLNGTPPTRMPLWLLRMVLLTDSHRSDRLTFGIFDVSQASSEYIGTIELYDMRHKQATLGIIIGERSHWNRGFGPEAIEALLDYAFTTLGLEHVRLSTFADNTRAQQAFKKVGFHEKRRLLTSSGRVDVQMACSKWWWLEHQAMSEAEHLPYSYEYER